MPELRSVMEWNAQEGDCFRYHHPGSTRPGQDRVFVRFSSTSRGGWIDSSGGYAVSLPFWELVRRADKNYGTPKKVKYAKWISEKENEYATS